MALSFISSLTPFPSIDWWMSISGATEVRMDVFEHFQKMSRRNRYRIYAANGPVLLSIPLLGSRNQRNAMKEVQIDNEGQWQKRQWRTLVSAYRRAPFFEHFEPELEQFFTKSYESLTAFNLESTLWLAEKMNTPLPYSLTESYQARYEGATDIRDEVLRKEQPVPESFLPRYYQLFSDRYGFAPNLSALDLLLLEGPAAGGMIREAGRKWREAKGKTTF